MKVLFAVNNDDISEKIIKRYQKDYKEILSYKNVYYFNAILKELQQDKTYDRVVISEDLEPFANNNYDTIDKFIFDKLDNISDETTDAESNNIEIILICVDRRTKSDEMLVKLFGLGIYNAIIGEDRSIQQVCKLINKPRSKKEAKQYYKIETDSVNYQPENENSVSETEVRNILEHYRKLGKNEEKYVESFNSIVSQYNDIQLKIIIKCLPIGVKAVLEERSPKYQELITFEPNQRTKLVSQTGKTASAPAKKVQEKMIDKASSKNKISRPIVIPEGVNKKNVKKLIKEESKPVNNDIQEVKTIKSVDTMKTQKMVPTPIKSETEKANIKLNTMQKNIQKPVTKEIKQEKLEEKQAVNKVETVKQVVEEIVEPVNEKRGRGRPRKNQVEEEKEELNVLPLNEEDEELDLIDLEETENQSVNSKIENEDDEDLDLFDLDEEEESEEIEAQDEEDDDEGLDLFDLEDDEEEEPEEQDEEDDEGLDLFDLDDDEEEPEEIEAQEDEDDEGLDLFDLEDDEEEPEEIEVQEDEDDEGLDLFDLEDDEEEPEEIEVQDDEEDDDGLDLFDDDEEESEEVEEQDYEEDDDGLDLFGEDEEDEEPSNNKFESRIKPISVDYDEEAQNNLLAKATYTNSNIDLSTLLTKDKKVVSFVGTTKNGTSFVVNNVATMLSSIGISTAVLDITKNKNSYYIYTDVDNNLKNIAKECIYKLRTGIAEGIKVNKNLTIFTGVPEDDSDYSDVGSILSTLIQNYSAVLIDCDFDTPMEYFANSQEIYLVQSMDVLTMQPLTAFLRNLQSKGILKEEKVKVVINKGVKIKSVSIKALIGGISKYNDPSMSYMKDLFDPARVPYCVIPFQEQNYIKYLDSVINCNLTLNGYTKDLITALKELAGMVYPLINRQTYSPRGNQYKDNFSADMNDTLNQMKRKYQ